MHYVNKNKISPWNFLKDMQVIGGEKYKNMMKWDTEIQVGILELIAVWNQDILFKAWRRVRQISTTAEYEKRVNLTLTTFDLRLVCIFRHTKDRIVILHRKSRSWVNCIGEMHNKDRGMWIHVGVRGAVCGKN